MMLMTLLGAASASVFTRTALALFTPFFDQAHRLRRFGPRRRIASPIARYGASQISGGSGSLAVVTAGNVAVSHSIRAASASLAFTRPSPVSPFRTSVLWDRIRLTAAPLPESRGKRPRVLVRASCVGDVLLLLPLANLTKD